MRSSLPRLAGSTHAWSGFVSDRAIGHVRPWPRPPAQPGSSTERGVLSACDRPRPGGTLTPSPRSRVLVGAAAAWTLVAALAFGTFAIGGADSYGYAGQARLLRHGRLTETIPLKPAFRWPDARATLIPLGFTGGREPGGDGAAVSARLAPPDGGIRRGVGTARSSSSCHSSACSRCGAPTGSAPVSVNRWREVWRRSSSPSVQHFSTSWSSRWATFRRRRAGSPRSSPRHDRRSCPPEAPEC